jgi:16S rRNA (guanine1207-N2)-methyltransferase
MPGSGNNQQLGKNNHYYSKQQNSKLVLKKVNAEFFGKRFSISTASGVFSFEQVDRGTEILLQNCILKDCWYVLDLGCGNGIVGIAVALGFPNSEVVMTDLNSRAVNTVKMNIKANRILNAKVFEGNIFAPVEKEKFDTILLNPPQSAGKDICIEMIRQSKEHLKEGGLLQVVARHNKGGKSLSEEMKKAFGNLDISAKKSGYWVYISGNETKPSL